MRFDDSLGTVLSADMSTPFGAQSAWRQLVDLIGRRRVPASAGALARLRAIRREVPPPVRAASARGLAFADPPAALVRLFIDDELGIAAPVLGIARLLPEEWIAMLPDMPPAARSILRHRRDLAPEVSRALESYGVVDFILPGEEAGSAAAALQGDRMSTAQPSNDENPGTGPVSATPLAMPFNPGDTPFVSVGSVTRGLPVVAEAIRRAATPGDEARSRDGKPGQVDTSSGGEGPFRIAELVARLDAYQRHRKDTPYASPLTHDDHTEQPELFAVEPVQSQAFRFETDAAGVVRWIEGAARAPLIGMSLDLAALPNGARVDGVAAGAFRRRAGFSNARLIVEGTSDAAGQWRITGIPAFDRANGRFTGYRGAARRPRADEAVELLRGDRNPAADALRQLVHELRTPTNAIAGFAEMIERELLGPAPLAYRDYATVIRNQAAELLTAIDDIDLAARLETHALDLRPGHVPLAPLLTRIAEDLAPLATMRATNLHIAPLAGDVAVAGDDRAVERLIARLMATLVAAGGSGEAITVTVTASDAEGMLGIRFDRPRALAAYWGDTLLAIDAEAAAEADGAPLLGTGFALRLARNLAIELGGALTIAEDALTLRLPAALALGAEQMSSR